MITEEEQEAIDKALAEFTGVDHTKDRPQPESGLLDVFRYRTDDLNYIRSTTQKIYVMKVMFRPSGEAHSRDDKGEYITWVSRDTGEVFFFISNTGLWHVGTTPCNVKKSLHPGKEIVRYGQKMLRLTISG